MLGPVSHAPATLRNAKGVRWTSLTCAAQVKASHLTPSITRSAPRMQGLGHSSEILA